MMIEARTSFAGVLTMHKGQVLEYDNKKVIQDLIKAGYVKEVKKTSKKDVGTSADK